MKNNQKEFTLIELIIVVAIIGILAGRRHLRHLSSIGLSLTASRRTRTKVDVGDGASQLRHRGTDLLFRGCAAV